MAEVQLWCRVTVLEGDGTVIAHFELEGPGAPDLYVLDHLARMALLTRREGGDVVFSDLSASLQRLLDLAGLSVEMKGKPEEGEEPLWVHHVEEELHAGDLPR